jgi:DNA polymerase
MKEEQLLNVKQELIIEVEKTYPGDGKVVVFGEGNLDADILLIGEAPGEKETKFVKPFVGQAGKNLDEFLQVLELKREEIYITNTVKFRPYKVNPKTGRLSNRPPSKEEIKLCLPFLLKQLDIIKPKIVVTLGNTPLQTITGDNKVLIGENHGRPIKTDKFYLFPLYHPASIIYNAGLKETYHEDLLMLKDFITEHV